MRQGKRKRAAEPLSIILARGLVSGLAIFTFLGLYAISWLPYVLE